jgi:hypothetical protein
MKGCRLGSVSGVKTGSEAIGAQARKLALKIIKTLRGERVLLTPKRRCCVLGFEVKEKNLILIQVKFVVVYG